MTEERFEEIMEYAADKLDRSLNRAWKYKPVRFIGKGFSCLAGVGLIAASFSLFEKGKERVAKICLISGGIVIAAAVLEFVIFKKE